MILAYHIVFGTYGFWLPNDPRGSWSDFVWSWELFRFGGSATKVDARHSLANVSHDVQQRLETKKHLKYPPVILNGLQARAVARGFAKAVAISDIPVFACSIMPEHVHLILGPLRREPEKIVKQLKQNATIRLNEEAIHPLGCFPGPPSPWGRFCWKVFLTTNNAVFNAIDYVKNNPIKEGKKPQNWSFVRPPFSRGASAHAQ